MKIRGLNIVLINIKQYNLDQLSVISDSLGIEGNYLQDLKSSNASKVWISINGDNKIIEAICGVFTDIKGSVTTYKDSGLVILNGFTDLSKKEKDSLLKMKPTEFSTKRKAKTLVESKSPVVEKVKEVIDVDSLMKQLQICVQNEEYEKAAVLRDKINSLSK